MGPVLDNNFVGSLLRFKYHRELSTPEYKPMRFRRTKTHSDAQGEPRYSVRLVKSERFDDKVKQITLLNLGTKWEVPQTLWKSVAHRVEELML